MKLKIIIFSLITVQFLFSPIYAVNDTDDRSKIQNLGKIFISFDLGYRYPTQSINSFDHGFDIPKTSADKIYHDGFTFGFKAGYIWYPFIFSISIDGGVLSLTDTGKSHAKNINPEEYAQFGPFIGAYLYETGLFSFYAGISPGLISVAFDNDYIKTDKSHKNYFGLMVHAGVQLRPFDLATIQGNFFFTLNFKYQTYTNKKVIPNDFIVTLGAGAHVGLFD